MINESHVIDSWIAELALGARSNRPQPAPVTMVEAIASSERAPVAAKPTGRRFAALRDRPRPVPGSLRPCLSTA